MGFMNRIFTLITLVFFIVTGCNNSEQQSSVETPASQEEVVNEIIKEKQYDDGMIKYSHFKNASDKYPYKAMFYFPNGEVESESYFDENGDPTEAYVYFLGGQLSLSYVVENGITTQKEYYEDEYISSQRRERMKMDNASELVKFDDSKNRLKRVREYVGKLSVSDVMYNKSGIEISRYP
jgi:antitoxin component YwqK of YwqJK toxin-antitoxin module